MSSPIELPSQREALTEIAFVCLFLALRLFNSDKILTISLNFGQKSKYKKKHSTSAEE